MRLNRKKNNIIIGGLCAILLIMTVGYAAFYSQLKISGTSTVTSNWDVEITNIESKNIVGSASNKVEPSYEKLTATFNTNLVSPSDSITYDITVENKGSIDATLKTITKTDTSNSAILFETSGLKEGGTLQAGRSATLTVKVTYDSNVTTQPDNLTSTLKVTLDFVQNSGDIVPIEPEPIMMARDDTKAFWQSIYDSKISTVDVLTNKDVPTEAVESWDVSEEQNGTVMAWIIDDSENSGKYKLYIGGDGGVYAPSDSSYLFAVDSINASVSNVFYKTISLNLKNLNTENTVNMRHMFAYLDYDDSKLTTLDISNFNTSKVTNMSYMFYNCSSITTLDLSNFDTSQVTDMSWMFSNCSSLTSLNLNNFDTSSVTDMSDMFRNSRQLTNLDLCSFDTSKVTNMYEMFIYTPKLTAINVSSKWTTASAATTDMFIGSGVSSVTTGQC